MKNSKDLKKKTADLQLASELGALTAKFIALHSISLICYQKIICSLKQFSYYTTHMTSKRGNEQKHGKEIIDSTFF